MRNTKKYGLVMALVVSCFAAGVMAAGEKVVAEWKFDEATQWNGWSPNALVRNAQFSDDGVTFDSAGPDPIIMGPSFELKTATNQQWVVIDMDCPERSQGELYYTNKTEGKYSGLEPHWRSVITVSPGTNQSVSVWPFWSSLGKVIRLRFDPPTGKGVKLRAIRIVELAGAAPAAAWKFGEQEDSWRSMYAAQLERTAEGLKVRAGKAQAVIITPVEPFDASKKSMLKLDAACAGEDYVTLYWASTQEQGLFGTSLWIKEKTSCAADMRSCPEWKGTITHLAIAFGTRGGEELMLKSLSIFENDPKQPFLCDRYFDFDRGMVRAGQTANVRLIVEHAGGPVLPAANARVFCNEESATCDTRVVAVPAMGPGSRAEIRVEMKALKAGAPAVSIEMPNGQTFTKVLLIKNALTDPEVLARPDGYDVPKPKPVKTDYQIGVYYFPGWSADQLSRWQKQADFPERDSLLGWYDEGKPEVADWHIKWAVENGLSFFIYDWYWRDGKEVLGAGLNEGFLKARYNEMMKFAIMWANHPPFNQHTPEQLLAVTDYWIEHYFRRPNYLKVDGKPYVSFFSTGQLISDMGSEDKVKGAFDAMREKARKAGLKGIHFAGCTGGDAGVMDSLKRAGFDSVTAYNYPRIGTELAQSPYKHYMLAHDDIWKTMSASGKLPYTPLLTVNWDARPWHGPRTDARFDRLPSYFAEGLERLKSHLDSTGQKMAILEAWNEWGEGSYLEPNVEFGFGDLEAIRATFAVHKGIWPQNVSPNDVGLEGKYDLRRKVESVGKHPAVSSGLDLICRGDRLTVTPGKYVVNGKEVETAGGDVAITPAETVEIKDLPIKLVAEPPQTWHLGNRLIISPQDRRNVLPESYVPGSLVLRDPSQPEAKFASPQDFFIDDMWGAFGLTPNSRLKAGQEAKATYRMSMRRVDALVLDEQGKPQLIQGKPSADCPDMPAVPAGAFHLANIYRPYKAIDLKPEHVYVLSKPKQAKPVVKTEALEPVLAKLRDGKPVTIVCWGDSVTACGESSSPATCYVGLFESMLKERYPKAAIKIVNASIGGTSTPGRFPNYQKEVLDFKPDVVTLEFVNDMGIPVDQMQQRYTEILARTREAGAVLLLITPHYVRPDWMNMTTARFEGDPRPDVAFLRKFAADNKLPLADAAGRWEELDPLGLPYEILLRNGINHPEDRGHRFFAEELMRLFE